MLLPLPHLDQWTIATLDRNTLGFDDNGEGGVNVSDLEGRDFWSGCWRGLECRLEDHGRVRIPHPVRYRSEDRGNVTLRIVVHGGLEMIHTTMSEAKSGARSEATRKEVASEARERNVRI